MKVIVEYLGGGFKHGFLRFFFLDFFLKNIINKHQPLLTTATQLSQGLLNFDAPILDVAPEQIQSNCALLRVLRCVEEHYTTSKTMPKPHFTGRLGPERMGLEFQRYNN